MHAHRAPTIRQVYALAAALCDRLGEDFPETRLEASALIERLRLEIGHPAPRLRDTPLRRGRRSIHSRVAAELVREMRR